VNCGIERWKSGSTRWEEKDDEVGRLDSWTRFTFAIQASSLQFSSPTVKI
jgi:hypothetical protein